MYCQYLFEQNRPKKTKKSIHKYFFSSIIAFLHILPFLIYLL